MINLKSKIIALPTKIIPTKQSVQSETTVDLSDKTVLIYDLGVMTEAAVRMAKDFKEVKYFCPFNQGGLPKSNLALIGENLDGITRVQDFWEEVDKADLICFFDTYCSDMVEYLRNKGYRVFGAGHGEKLELDRWYGRETQKEAGLPVQKTIRIVGVDNLIEYLKKNEKKWIKINSFRGDIETFFHDNYDETEAQFLGRLMVETGARGKTLEFIVEDEIGEAEIGYDGWVVDGEYPSVSMMGYEKKDTAYLGKSVNYEELPEAVKLVNEKLKPKLKELGGRTFFSTEVRIAKDGKGYLIDPCVRAAMLSPSDIYTEMWKNYSEIIWFSAEGRLIEPISAAKYAASIWLESFWAKQNWTLIDFPPAIRQWIKLRMAFKTEDGKYYALPGFESLGSVIGLGDTPEEAVKAVKKNVEKVNAKELNYSFSCLEEILDKMIPSGQECGIEF